MGLWNGATSKGGLRCKVGNSRSMPCGSYLWKLLTHVRRTGVEEADCATSEEFKFYFSAGKERLTCGATLGWFHTAMWQENRNGRSRMRHLRGGFFYFFWCREVWTCGRQVSAVWRSFLKWRHLRRRFEFQMGGWPWRNGGWTCGSSSEWLLQCHVAGGKSN